MGMARPVHLLARGAEVEEIVNVVAIAVVDARDGEPVTATPEAAKTLA
jgi:phosphotransacetylase